MDDTSTTDVPVGAEDRRRWQTPVLVLAVLAVVGVAAFAWLSTRPGTTRMCTLTAALGNPVADTPEQAMDAWWDDHGAEVAQQWASLGPSQQPPARQDFRRVGDGRWEWRYTTDDAVAVDVGPPHVGDGERSRWSVVAVNRCTYGASR